MIEARQRTLENQWLYVNTLDSLEAGRWPVACGVAAHDKEIPHSAFQVQFPEQICFGRTYRIPEALRHVTHGVGERILRPAPTWFVACQIVDIVSKTASYTSAATHAGQAIGAVIEAS